MKDQIVEIKPCPFCGGGASLSGGERGEQGFYVIRCTGGHAIRGTSGGNALISEWNNRSAIKVKALSWKGYGEKITASTYGISGVYRIERSTIPHNKKSWRLSIAGETDFFHNYYETQGKCKKAAQDHHRENILKSLDL